jgi:hypothetical protein
MAVRKAVDPVLEAVAGLFARGAWLRGWFGVVFFLHAKMRIHRPCLVDQRRAVQCAKKVPHKKRFHLNRARLESPVLRLIE